jgi:hypothetical protein
MMAPGNPASGHKAANTFDIEDIDDFLHRIGFEDVDYWTSP